MAPIHITNTDIKILVTALEQFREKNNSYPSTKEGLQALIINPNSEKYQNWEKHFNKSPVDPWGNKYQYLSPGIHVKFDVYSLGPDGVQSKDDIGNW